MVRHAVSGWKDGWYVVPYRVIFRDLDYFGHVNNAVYLTYFEIARTDLWLQLIGGKEAGDVGFIVARAECDFRLQIGLEEIEIAVRIGEMRETSFDFLYEIRKSDGRQIAATGKVVVVYYDWKKQSKARIPDELRRHVQLLQSQEG
ncbi:MAG TPA: thioesterase family protein [Thermoanaerobaculia bacterium]|nr:thioesterase family protein [Thermoanaerobaculia bacterium]